MVDVFNQRARIIVTCSNRISPALARELHLLGYDPRRAFKTGAELFGTMADCIRLNLNLRCAGQVLFSIAEFRAENADELYRKLTEIAWEKILPADGYFSVSSNVSNETISNNLFANVKVKDAVADRFREKTGARPDSGPMLNAAVIHLYWKENRAEVFLDSSGETLSKHGYRKIPGKAPMLESLAAAAVSTTTWDCSSPFINPMCGSGTLAIEAALLATDRRPGLNRDNYSFMHLLGYRDDIYRSEYDLLQRAVISKPALKIIATDISEDGVNIARINAGMAGVEEMISFGVCDFRETEMPADAPGIVFFNPEYGDRLGEEDELANTYAAIGDFMKKKCRGYTGYIFTGNLELAKKIGLRPKRRIEFYTGKIDCRLLEYELYAGSREVKTPAPE